MAHAAIESSPARDRILRVIRREGLPDRVPVEIGIGPWYACKLLGATTVDLVHHNPSPQEVMLEAFRRYDYDPWLWATNSIALPSRWVGEGEEPRVVEDVVCDTSACHRVNYRVETPLGPLTWALETVAGRPTLEVEYPIKDIDRDWPRYRYWMGEARDYDPTFVVDELVAGKGVGGVGACLPVSWWVSIREGGITSATYDMMERPEVMATIFQWYTKRTLAELDAALKAEPRSLFDAYFIQGSSSSLSHSSLPFFVDYDLPFLKAVTAVTKKAGVPSHLHVCGRSRAIVDLAYAETDLAIMEPLERDPGGDCDLAQLKTLYGHKLVLKGNLNTFQLLAYGTEQEVRDEARRCLDAAMEGGGFWLATGDQTPANAPEANLFALVETAREYGKF